MGVLLYRIYKKRQISKSAKANEGEERECEEEGREGEMMTQGDGKGKIRRLNKGKYKDTWEKS